jgi:arabinose-5-phosphate isomerase
MSALNHVAESLSPFEQIRLGREILDAESAVISQISSRLGNDFSTAVNLISDVSGSVIVTGMGKAGLIGQKLVATFASTGTPSHFLHPGEAFHGDLGRIQKNDCVLLLSFSGETEEVTKLIPSLKNFGVPMIAMTGNLNSKLGLAADVVLDLSGIREACTLGLAPSASTTAMLSLGDALALVISRMKNFSPEDFARYHPGGSLGRKLSNVEQVMRPRRDCRMATCGQTVREVLVSQHREDRRSGAILVVDDKDELIGLFTDSDLAKLLERRQDNAIDMPIEAVMTTRPTTVFKGSLLRDALEILVGRKFSELPVTDRKGSPVGLIDVTDVIGLIPKPSDKDSA